MTTPDSPGGGRTGVPRAPASTLDDLDRRILALFCAQPQVGVLQASRRLGVARGTVQSRLDRLNRSGVISSWAPVVSPANLGFGVTAFVTIEIRPRGDREAVLQHLRSVPEILECWTVTGKADLLCRIVGGSNTDLQRVIDHLTAHDDVLATSTQIGLNEVIGYRTDLLVAATGHR